MSFELNPRDCEKLKDFYDRIDFCYERMLLKYEPAKSALELGIVTADELLFFAELMVAEDRTQEKIALAKDIPFDDVDEDDYRGLAIAGMAGLREAPFDEVNDRLEDIRERVTSLDNAVEF